MRRLAVSLLVLGVSLACFQGCYGATEILVQIQTDVACSTVRKTGIAVRATGATSTLPDADVLASSTTCTDGTNGQPNDVGTLVFVPTSDTPQVSIRVVLGVERPTDTCDGATSAGCITADRRITYEKHRTLHLPIRLDGACTGRVCAEGQTCSAGLCVSSISTCSGASCGSVGSADASTSGTEPPIVILPDGGISGDGGLPFDAGPVCPPLPNAGCDCSAEKAKTFCCFTTGGPVCTVNRATCETMGTYGCSDACQCTAGRTCGSSTSCSADGVARRTCGACTTDL